MATKIVSRNYGFDAAQSFKKYVPNSDSTQEDIDEIVLQFLLKGYEIPKVHAYWAWLQYCKSIGSHWIAVTSMYDVPTLTAPFIEKEKPVAK